MQRQDEGLPQAGEFFQLEPDVRRGGKGHGVMFENVASLLTPPRAVLRPRNGGFPALKETPRLTYHPDQGSPPQDLEGGMSGYWLVSDRLRQVMEDIDAGAFAFAEVHYEASDGGMAGGYSLCDVTRTLDALNEGMSVLNIEVSDEFEAGKFYDLTGEVRLAFHPEVLRGAHVFRLAFHGGVFCDRVFRSAVEKAGVISSRQSNGLWFYDVGGSER
ncbi:TPA: DUF1629 domain-containing protein [Stenotrophomonas maltophilia]|nr:DUF1629 domain-containing protein [Stenotrophomonas maltophilia]HDS1025273.1 DUF1629 domain-containing protein [Stenotrophomonas maltophilia]HDS1029526.1 DUF1629 domain-containing protein [Stenotrophomonas maltophilia]HDS1034144.1 DUF1629 domain-containing protein [Stenotrophomonas maltophilia]